MHQVLFVGALVIFLSAMAVEVDGLNASLAGQTKVCLRSMDAAFGFTTPSNVDSNQQSKWEQVQYVGAFNDSMIQSFLLDGANASSTVVLNRTTPNGRSERNCTAPNMNQTAECMAFCMGSKTTYKTSFAISGEMCYCLSSGADTALGEVPQKRYSACQVSSSASTSISTSTTGPPLAPLKVYHTFVAKLKCPLLADATTCKDYGDDRDFECQLVGGCCQFIEPSCQRRYFCGTYGTALQYGILVILVLALFEGCIYSVLRVRAHRRGERWGNEPLRANDTAEEMSQRLLDTFPVQPPTSPPQHLVPGNSRPVTSSLLRPIDANDMQNPILAPSTAAQPTSDLLGIPVSDEDANSCAICLEDMVSDMVRLPCGHGIHAPCIKQYIAHWLRNNNEVRCPLCRACIGSAKELERRSSKRQ